MVGPNKMQGLQKSLEFSTMDRGAWLLENNDLELPQMIANLLASSSGFCRELEKGFYKIILGVVGGRVLYI